jgi:hypothetical protein
LARTSGFARACSTVSGSSGQAGINATYPASSNNAAQGSQLEGSSHSPCTKTTGVAVVAFARSTCSSSWSVIDVAETLVLISSSSVRPAAGPTIVGFIQSLFPVWASVGLVFLTMVWLSQSSKRVGATLHRRPG